MSTIHYSRNALLAAAALLVSACNSAPEKAAVPVDGPATATASSKTGSASEERLRALGTLRRQLDDTSGEGFARSFDFPVLEADFYPLIESAAFTDAYEAAGRTLSRELFLKHFVEIATSLELDEFRETLRRIEVRDLQKSDSIQITATADAKTSCMRFYGIRLRGDELLIQYGSDHNAGYIPRGEDDGSVCEWATIWAFRYREGAWRFAKMYQAG